MRLPGGGGCHGVQTEFSHTTEYGGTASRSCRCVCARACVCMHAVRRVHVLVHPHGYPNSVLVPRTETGIRPITPWPSTHSPPTRAAQPSRNSVSGFSSFGHARSTGCRGCVLGGRARREGIHDSRDIIQRGPEGMGRAGSVGYGGVCDDGLDVCMYSVCRHAHDAAAAAHSFRPRCGSMCEAAAWVWGLCTTTPACAVVRAYSARRLSSTDIRIRSTRTSMQIPRTDTHHPLCSIATQSVQGTRSSCGGRPGWWKSPIPNAEDVTISRGSAGQDGDGMCRQAGRQA